MALFTEIDEEWLTANIHDFPVDLHTNSYTIDRSSMNDAGGLAGDMTRLRLLFAEERGTECAREKGEEKTMVVKRTRSQTQSVQLGMAREAFFYNSDLRKALQCGIPKIFYAHGDMKTGLKDLIMEDLTHAAQCGHFFGPGSPLNWGKDLDTLKKGFDLSAYDTAQLAFSHAAKLHSEYWAKESFMTSETLEWLRGGRWVVGEGRETWEGTHNHCKDLWLKARADGKLESIEPSVVAIIDASQAKCTWDNFQEDLKSRPFTLVHGDFHPANMMVAPAAPTATAASSAADGEKASWQLYLLDWENVGVGSGPQELGQYMISHAAHEFRRDSEVGLVNAYYDELCQLNPKVVETMSREQCHAEYVNGAVAKWMWLLPLLVAMCPPPMTAFFTRQVADFIETHDVTPSNVPMPRS